MKNYIESFYFPRELYFIEEINKDEIKFSNSIDTPELYIPNIQKANENNISDILPNTPIYNIFDLLDDVDTSYLYIVFSNLLQPKNKKEKLDIEMQIKNFINTYGYIFPFSSNEKKNKIISRPLSEIKNEIEKMNIIVSIYSLLKNSFNTIPKLHLTKFLNDGILKTYCTMYDFDNGFNIKNKEQLNTVKHILKEFISYQLNSIISNCNFAFSYFDTPQYSIKCNSLLEVMYLQFITDITLSNTTYGFCEYCGKLVPIDNYNKNKKHIYCRMSSAEKNLLYRSPCATNAAMQRYRDKQKNK